MPSTRPVFPLRLPAELRVRAEGRAADLGIPLNALVAVALDAYLGAVAPGPKSMPVVSRSKPCPCGSGKKNKHCHGA